MLAGLWKPWFIYQPTQVIRRARIARHPPIGGYVSIRTSWGGHVTCDPARMIGRSIATTGVYDLAVSEVLVRLIAPGETVIDAGANVGYMTLLASLAAGRLGHVLAFEPHPELFPVLRANVAASPYAAGVTLHQCALSDRPGSANLDIPFDFSSNDGIASLGAATANSRSVRVQTCVLDSVFDGIAAVLKLDVEGFESQVLRGATRLLAGRRLRHILFEDHAIEQSVVMPLLRDAGYRVFSLGWTMRGPAIEPVDRGRLATEYEAPNYVATLDPDQLLARCRPRGWRTLRTIPVA